jgi:single-stranded-DNA-specific exonuclease
MRKFLKGQLSAEVRAQELVGQLLVRRGIDTPDRAEGFLDPACYSPAPATDLPDLTAARRRLITAVRAREQVAVWGDFDVDGQTSTALLVSALADLGLEPAYYIPLRDTESHGLNIPGLKRLFKGGVDLLITCDTGVDDHKAAAFAREQGVDLIITDHHELPDQLPAAEAVVNPNRLSPDHPLYHLPGAGVAYKLIEDLYHALGKDPSGLLDLVALAVVSDIAVQRGDTRYLLQKGLEVLRTSPRPGLQVLYDEIGLDHTRLTENELGFQIGPHLNAVGRLEDANQSVEFLTADSRAAAVSFVRHLILLNRRRRDLTERIFQQALEMVTRHPHLLEDYHALVLSSPDWHPGVIGIVASRLVDRFGKPTLLFVEEDQRVRGSARSVPGISIIDFIAMQDELLTAYGGHPMAAGMQLPADSLPAFRRRLSQAMQTHGADPAQASVLQIEQYLTLAEVNLGLVNDLGRLAPFGPGNPPPVLAARDLTLEGMTVIGKDRAHRKLTVRDDQGESLEVLWWNSADLPDPPERLDLAFQISENYYRGRRRLQVTLEDLRETSRPAAPVSGPANTRSLIDLRNHPNPLEKLPQLLKQEHASLQIFREDAPGSELPGTNRLELSPAEALVIWTQPASALILSSVINQVDPERIYFFSNPPPYQTLAAFLVGLTRMVKYNLSDNNYDLSIPLLAAAASQTEGVIFKAVQWMGSRGQIEILSQSGPTISIKPEFKSRSLDISQAAPDLLRAFAETQSFRIYYRRNSLENIL